jgi:hypothetical protein
MSNQYTALPMPERFWTRVAKADGCWKWTGPHQRVGYAMFGKGVAHRTAYELAVGPIPLGYELDHLCRNRGCVNPAHLEPVSRRENIMRSANFAAVNARKTHCPKGHPYAGANLHVASSGDRRCVICKAAANAARLSPTDQPEAE